MEEVSGSLSDAQIEQAGLPSTSRLELGRIASRLVGLSALALLIALYAKREKALLVGGGAVGLALVSVALNPAIEGLTFEDSPRIVAAYVLIPLIIAVGGAWMAKKGTLAVPTPQV